MPMWRCPHCRTPQPEAARCWVCHASSTACASCRHFRRSIAAQLGYCGLDRTRAPLAGTEIRACWEAAPAVDAVSHVAASPAVPATSAEQGAHIGRTPVRGRDFVPVVPAQAVATELAEPTELAGAAPPAAAAPMAPVADPASGAPGNPARDVPIAAFADPEGRWSLWGELEA